MSQLSTYKDQDLLVLMSDNDSLAFEELWNRYWEQGYNAAYKRLKDEELSRDLIQDLFIDLWTRRDNLVVNNISAYLNTAIRYKVYKILSKTQTNIPFYETLNTVVSTAVGADNLVVEKELQQLAEAWLDTLPAKRKEIFLLYYRENLSTKEIAERLQISQKTVQNQLGVATNALRKRVIITLLQITAY